MRITAKQLKYMDFLWGLSLANLMLIKSWRELIYRDSRNCYFLVDYGFWNYASAIVLVCGLTVLLFLIIRTFRSLSKKKQYLDLGWRLVFLILLLPVADFFRQSTGIGQNYLNLIREQSWFIAILLIALIAVCGILALRFFRWWTSALYFIVVLLFPFVVINFSRSVPYLLQPPGEVNFSQETAADGVQAGGGLGRVVWILFDAFDYDIAFEHRPADADLSAFDALREVSFFFNDVEPPGGATAKAIPGLMLGTEVTESNPLDCAKLEVTLSDGTPPFNFGSGSRAVMKQAAELGADISITGFHHPYCRLFDGSYRSCSTFSMAAVQIEAAGSFFAGLRDHLQAFSPLARRISASRTLERISEEAVTALKDPGLEFIFIHVSVPHLPHIFDRKKNRLVLTNFRLDGYIDNLVLADRVFARFRAALEEAELWDETAVIVSSDHGWGDKRRYLADELAATERIPFLVKLPGQKEKVEVRAPFSSLRTKDLILQLLAQSVRTTEDFRDFLDAPGGGALPANTRPTPESNTPH